MSHYSAGWKPKRSIAECDRIITAPGSLHELEQKIIDGRVLRVYKNLPPNCRVFWLALSTKWRDRDYLVFENERYTYGQVAEKASRLASMLYTRHGVRKGDRVAIIMRNFPEFIFAFWAIHLLGGVATLVNAWAPSDPLLHCIVQTNPKIIIVDPERANRLAEGILDEIKLKTLINKVFVARVHDEGYRNKQRPLQHSYSNWRWKGMSSLDDALASFKGPLESWREVPESSPEDDATIFFTSGTTGYPKGVLSSHRAFLTNFFNSFVARFRSYLRDGDSLPAPDPNEPQKSALLSVPLFHVTGCTSTMITCTGFGSKMVLMRKWDKEEAARLISTEGVTSAGGVPSMVMDLLESSLKDGPLEQLACGGAPASDSMPRDVQKRFKNVIPGQGYGLSETNAIAASIYGQDFLARPASTGAATLVNDLLIVDPVGLKVLSPGQIGELWIKGPNIMKGYWGDSAATEKAITKDGYFRSGDLATIDEEGFVYIKDRAKDIIIRGGENIHSVEVENALYADERLLDAAAVSVPDRRLGELVAAVVATKPHFRGQVTEEDVIEHVKRRLPSYAVPVMVLVQDDLIDRNANGKIVKGDLRKRVRKEWAIRQKQKDKGPKKTAKAKL